MNWSKGLIVKEKILLHLLDYRQYSELDEVPEQITQQGISTTITAPRPHVSMALKDLRDKDQINERICHIIHGKRRQKVYFLTSSGYNIANQIKTRVLTGKIVIIDKIGKSNLTCAQVISKYKIPLLEIINRATPTGEIDLTKPSEPTDVKVQPPPPQTPKPKTEVKPKPPESAAATEHRAKRSYYEYPPEEYRYQSNIPSPEFQYYPEDYQSDPRIYYPSEPLISFSEKTGATLFYIGYLLILLAIISGLLVIETGNFVFIIPTILFLIIGIILISVSASTLWSNKLWQQRITNLLVVTIPIIVYIFSYAAIDSSLSYYDLGLWLIIIISFLMVANFGTFIPINNRAQILGALGIIILINSPIIYSLKSLNVYQAGFWIVLGIICLYVGYALLVAHEKDTKNRITEHLAPGIGVGLGVGIFTACISFVLIYDFQKVSAQEYQLFLLVIIWFIGGFVSIIQTLREKGNQALDTVLSLQAGLPIFFGVILIFFGVFLIRHEKLMESILEIILGGILILYSIMHLKNQKSINFAFIGLITFAIILSLVLALYS